MTHQHVTMQLCSKNTVNSSGLTSYQLQLAYSYCCLINSYRCSDMHFQHNQAQSVKRHKSTIRRLYTYYIAIAIY